MMNALSRSVNGEEQLTPGDRLYAIFLLLGGALLLTATLLA